MSSNPSNPSAFPLAAQHRPNGEMLSHEKYGMTLRDYAAIKAMAAVLACEQSHPSLAAYSNEELSLCAYQIADTMLAEREKEA